MSAWVKMIEDEDATGLVKEMYDLARTPHGTVDNVMRCCSLRPKAVSGHMALYKSVLHNPDNVLPFWFLEVIASYTSICNNCEYSLTHHFMNVRRLLDDTERADAIFEALSAGEPEQFFSGKELALLQYTERLTTHVADMKEEDIVALRKAGCNDGEIVEANQVIAYFNYSNRTLNGLGVTTEGDVLGYYVGREK